MESILAQQYLNEVYPKKNFLGINKRKKITKLNLDKKNLTGALDLSDFVNLESLNCSNNKLTAINLASCSKLTWLICNENNLTELDLNQLINLKTLNCSNNQLINLDLNQCLELNFLNCCGNNLTQLNLDQQKNLNKLYCSNNQLQELTLTSKVNLEISTLSVGDNLLTNLNFLRNINKYRLQELLLQNNNFTSDLIPFSMFIYLRTLSLGNSDFRSFSISEKIKQGIYNKITGNLDCLLALTNLKTLLINNLDINAGTKALNKWLDEAEFTLYIANDLFPEAKVKVLITWLEQNKMAWQINNFRYNRNNFPNKEKNKFIKELNWKKLKLNGTLNLNNFTNLQKINCLDNQLTAIDARNCTKLIELDCSYNKITNLILPDSLQVLNCGFNEINPLDLPKNLQKLNCTFNKLKKIDFSNYRQLIELNCCDNPLTDIRLSLGAKLEVINIRFHKFTNLDFLAQINPASLRVLNLYCCTDLEKFNLTVFSKFINLEKLVISNCHSYGSLVAFSNCQKLHHLDLSYQFTEADLECLPISLEEFKFLGNQKVEKKLEPYNEDLKAWRQAHSKLVARMQFMGDLTYCQRLLQLAIPNHPQNELAYQALANLNNGFQIWAAEEIRLIKQEIIQEQLAEIEIT